MLWLEDIESEDSLTVAKWYIADWAKAVCVKMDDLDKRLKTVEGVMEHGHHEAPVITVGDVEERFPHNPDYGAPGSWGDAYAGVCALYVAAREQVATLERDNEELRQHLAEKPAGLLAECERLRARVAELEPAAANWVLVERMPLYMQIWRCSARRGDTSWAVQEAPGRHIEFASSPEAALRAALGEG